MPRKHTMPPFLDGLATPEAYERWLTRKANAHVKRDRARGRSGVTVSTSLYKEAIHAAVVLSAGLDAYTGDDLNWRLISTYKNDESKLGRHRYKAGFALLPTVDHVDAGASEAPAAASTSRTVDTRYTLCALRLLGF